MRIPNFSDIPLSHRLHRLRRSPLLYWVVAATLIGATAAHLSSRSAELDRKSREYGSARQVVLVRSAHRAGDVLDAGDVMTTKVPSGVVPDDAVRSFGRAQRLSVDVVGGEMLLRSRLRSTATSPTAAMLRTDEVAIGVEMPAGHVPLATNDHVELVALGHDGRTESLTEARVVATSGTDADATVTGARSITLAVDHRFAGAINDANVAGTLNVWLIGPQNVRNRSATRQR